MLCMDIICIVCVCVCVCVCGPSNNYWLLLLAYRLKRLPSYKIIYMLTVLTGIIFYTLNKHILGTTIYFNFNA